MAPSLDSIQHSALIAISDGRFCLYLRSSLFVLIGGEYQKIKDSSAFISGKRLSFRLEAFAVHQSI